METRLSRRRGRGVPHSIRRWREIVAALKLPRPESVDQRKRRLDSKGAEKKDTRLSNETLSKQRIDNSFMYHPACIAASYISYRASLHVHVSTACFILQVAYFTLHVHVPTITCLLVRTCLHLMSTTQLDRSRSPCILLIYFCVGFG